MEFIMNNFINNCKEFVQDEEGLTIVEYVIGAALLILAFTATGPFQALSDKLTTVIGDI
jgi:pilus assembly protein Flp/PilA